MAQNLLVISIPLEAFQAEVRAEFSVFLTFILGNASICCTLQNMKTPNPGLEEYHIFMLKRR
jgi:hypothetical protein